MKSVQDLLSDQKDYLKKLTGRHKYVTKEFQDYGYRLALKLGDLKNVSMYMKISKERERALVESALSFVVDYPNAKHKGRLFLWKLKQLEDDRKEMLKERKEQEKRASETMSLFPTEDSNEEKEKKE